MCTSSPNYYFSKWYHDRQHLSTCGKLCFDYGKLREWESICNSGVPHTCFICTYLPPTGRNIHNGYLRSDDNWDGKGCEGTESILKHSRLFIDFTYLAPTIKGWSGLATLVSVNWTTWQTVGRTTMLIVWKLFSILSIPIPFVLYYIQILEVRKDCKNCVWTEHVYYGIYARFLRSCCIFIGIIVGWLVN